MSGVQFPLVSPGFYMMNDSEHFRVVHSDPTKKDYTEFQTFFTLPKSIQYEQCAEVSN